MAITVVGCGGGVGRVWRGGFGAHKGGGEGRVGGLVAICERVQAAAEVERGDGDAILAIVDTPSVGKNVNVRALWTEFTVSL